MPDKPDNTLPTDPEAPGRPGDRPGKRPEPHRPGTGEGEYPVHPDRPNMPDVPPATTTPEPKK